MEHRSLDSGHAQTCEYHADIANGFINVRADIKWFTIIGKWILGVACAILGFLALQGLAFISTTNSIASKVDTLVMRADKVTEINRMQNEKIEFILGELIRHQGQIEKLRADFDDCRESKKGRADNVVPPREP